MLVLVCNKAAKPKINLLAPVVTEENLVVEAVNNTIETAVDETIVKDSKVINTENWDWDSAVTNDMVDNFIVIEVRSETPPVV